MNGHSNVPTRPEEQYLDWNKNLPEVLITKIAYYIVACVESLSTGSGVTKPTPYDDWHD
jgi:hypothetical protein